MPKPYPQEFGDDVVRVELGMSLLEAELIAQRATAAGLRVELLRNLHPETGGVFALGGSALLVRSSDEADLRELLSSSGY